MENTLLPTLTGLCFLISEVMPYISNFKYSSILHLIINIGNKILAKKPIDNQDYQPLLTDEQNSLHTVISMDSPPKNLIDEQLLKILENIRDPLINLNKIHCNFYDIYSASLDSKPKISNVNQMPLYTSEMYELNYIMNYLKTNYATKQLQVKNINKSNSDLLLSKGYRIDFDSEKDITIIKW